MKNKRTEHIFGKGFRRWNIWNSRHVLTPTLIIAGLILPVMFYVYPASGSAGNPTGVGIQRNTATAPSEATLVEKIFRDELQPKYFVHVVKKGQSLFRIARSYGMSVDDLKDLNNLTDDIVYIGQKLLVDTEGDINVSWYGDWFNYKPMSNGEPYHVSDLVIAHRYLPLGTCVELTNPANDQTVVAQVKDRIAERYAYRWDVSPRIFSEELGINPGVGVASLKYRIVNCDTSNSLAYSG